MISYIKGLTCFISLQSARGIDFPDVTQVIQIGMSESREQYIHRLGRTARAGKDGKGLLVLLPFESKFLSELKGLDVPKDEKMSASLGMPSQLELPEWMSNNFDRVKSKGNKLSTSAQLAYLAFLGFYLGQLNRISTNSKEDVVKISNDFSKAIGLHQVPSLPQKLVTKMDLVGVSGISVDEEG